jgi:4'-phosphopantetheinyl transferase
MKEFWVVPQERPVLGPDELHCWIAHLPSQRTLIDRAKFVLSADERERIGKFRFEAHRERALLARGILRFLLGAYSRTAPEQIVFVYGPHGKPAIETPHPLHFNTSHSGDYAAFAFTRLGDVGVDIELVRNDLTRREEIAARYFAPGEQVQLRNVVEAQRTHAFFDLWTRKEAFIKARGDGLFSGLEQFEVSLHEPRLLSVKGDSSQAGGWQVIALPEIAGYCGAAVVQAAPATPCFYNWTFDFARLLLNLEAKP